MVEINIEVRCHGMWALVWASHYPSLTLFKLVSRFVRFEYRTPGGRWHLSATAYQLIDWDSFDDDDDFGTLIPVWAI